MDRTQGDIRLGQAVAAYLAALPPGEKEAAVQELGRFGRWFGTSRRLAEITPVDLATYQEQLSQSGLDPAGRLEPLKAFLAHARRRGLLASNLAAHVRIKRRGTPPAPPSPIDRRAPGAVQMTRAGYQELQQELERLETEVRPQLTAELQRAAADKDFRENAPYDAVKEKLAQVHSRINGLKALLGAAELADDTHPAPERASLGTVVVLRDLASGEEIARTLAGPGESDLRQHRISVQSPLGMAVNQRRVGEEVEVQTPAGLARYRIESIRPAE